MVGKKSSKVVLQVVNDHKKTNPLGSMVDLDGKFTYLYQHLQSRGAKNGSVAKGCRPSPFQKGFKDGTPTGRSRYIDLRKSCFPKRVPHT